MFAREFELVFVLRPDLEDADIEAIRDRTAKVIADGDGHVLLIDDWGKRRLAYDIKKYGKGHFYVITFLAGPDLIGELERTLRIDDSVLRFLTVKLGDRVDVEARVAQEEARSLAARGNEEDKAADAPAPA